MFIAEIKLPVATPYKTVQPDPSSRKSDSSGQKSDQCLCNAWRCKIADNESLPSVSSGGFALWGVDDVTTGLIGGSDKAISAGGEVSHRPRSQFSLIDTALACRTLAGEALQAGLLNEVPVLWRVMSFFALRQRISA